MRKSSAKEKPPKRILEKEERSLCKAQELKISQRSLEGSNSQ